MELRSFNLKLRLKPARQNLAPAISAAELGRRLLSAKLPGFMPAQVSSLELGYRYATWSEVEALASALNVDPYWLANRQRPAPAVPRVPDVIWQVAAATPTKPAPVPAPVAPKPAPTVPAPTTALPTPSPAPAMPPDLAPADLPTFRPGAEVEFRRQMTEELARTLAKLGDTRLKPFEWRSWREHEKKIRAAAGGLMTLPD
jgi:hypothetical protein